MEPQPAADDLFLALPKVDLHRHLEGSLRLSTMVDIAHAHGISTPPGLLSLSGLVQIQEHDPLTFHNFLEKFRALRLFYRSPEVIHRITWEAVEDAARDHVAYLELRFTPVALSRAEGFPLHDVMDWVLEAARKAAEGCGIQVGLIASVNRHESIELAEQVSWLAAERMGKGMVGIDLAGNEAEFPGAPFAGLFREARQAGLHITIHAGEWGEAGNIREAIEVLSAERIGHGVRVLEDAAVTALAAERGTIFEVCITSNYQSGVVPAVGRHPLPSMLNAGLKATINTDDPSVSRITLSREFAVACDHLAIPIDLLKQCILRAGQAAFQPEDRRVRLVETLEKGLKWSGSVT